MSVQWRTVLVICVLTSMYLMASVEGDLHTKDGRKVYSFKSPFVVKFYHQFNFTKCITVSISWYNSKTPGKALSIRPTSDQLFSSVEGESFNYSAQMLPDRSTVNSFMHGYVEGRNDIEQEYKISVSLSCTYVCEKSFVVTSVLQQPSSINITLRYCPTSPQPRLKYGAGKSFNDSSKVYCDSGADLYDGTRKFFSNESISKCGRYGEWLDKFTCWFVPKVRLGSSSVNFHSKGDNVLFYCNVSEGYPTNSSAALWIGNQKWPNKNNFTMVQMTEWHNNKTVYCTASSPAGTGYSNNQTLTVYFPLILESPILCLKTGESNYSVRFTSNPSQKSSALHIILQVANSTNYTIQGIWEEETISKYGTWLQKFTASINLTETSALYIEYDAFGKRNSQKLNIRYCPSIEATSRSSITANDYITTGNTTVNDDRSSSENGIAAGVSVGFLAILMIAIAVVLVKRRQAQTKSRLEEPVQGDADYCTINSIAIAKPGRPDTFGYPTSYSGAGVNHAYTNVSMKSTYENVRHNSSYEIVGRNSTYENVAASSTYEIVVGS